MPAVAHDLLNRPSADASAVTPQVSHKSALPGAAECGEAIEGKCALKIAVAIESSPVRPEARLPRLLDLC